MLFRSTLPIPAKTAKTPTRPAGYLETYRYDDLGIGFEVQDKRVKAITLFPSPGQRGGGFAPAHGPAGTLPDDR